MRQRLLKGNTFVYLLALIVVLVCLSILLVGGISYRVSARALERETRQAMMLREAQVRARIEAELRTYQSVSQSLSVNPPILDQLTKASSMRVEDILRFRQIIQALNSLEMSMPASGVLLSVYFKRSDTVATQTTRYIGEEFFARFSEQDKAEILSRLGRAQHFALLVDVSLDAYGTLPAQRVLLLGKGLPYSNQYPFGGALVEVPIAHLESFLVPDDGCIQFVLSETDQLLLSASRSDTPGLLEAAQSYISGTALRSGNPFWFDATLCGEPHFLTVSVSSQDNWKYVTVTPAGQVFAGIRNISRVTLAVGALAALLAIAISALSLRRLYTPIKSLLDVMKLRGTPYPPRQKNERELEHINRIVNTAWRENENMQTLVSGMRDLMRQDTLGALLDNSAVDEDTIIKSGLDGMNGYFRAVLPEFTPSDGALSRYALCVRAVETIPQGLLPNGEILCIVRPHEQAALLVHTAAQTGEAALRPALAAVAEAINASAQAPCLLALGHEMCGVRTIGDSHMQAQEALYWALTQGRSGIVSHGEMLSSGQADVLSTLGRPGVTREDALRSLFAHAVGHGDYLVAYLLNQIRQSDDETADEALRDMMRLDSPGDRLDFLMQLSGGEKTGSRRLSASQLTQYLTEQYGNASLSLSAMAEHFGYTSNYLSTLIKEETGMGFLECLTHIRLERAKQLLTATDLRIADIATKTGFGHVNTFIRTFRRHAHATPAQYRAQMRAQGFSQY